MGRPRRQYQRGGHTGAIDRCPRGSLARLVLHPPPRPLCGWSLRKALWAFRTLNGPNLVSLWPGRDVPFGGQKRGLRPGGPAQCRAGPPGSDCQGINSLQTRPHDYRPKESDRAQTLYANVIRVLAPSQQPAGKPHPVRLCRRERGGADPGPRHQEQQRPLFRVDWV